MVENSGQRPADRCISKSKQLDTVSDKKFRNLEGHGPEIKSINSIET